MNARFMTLILVGFITLLGTAGTAMAHCQVPCGIYDDDARITAMKEDSKTIEKAVNSIVELAGKNDPQSLNQAVRWVGAKEDHASRIIEVISTYFLTQKIKPVTAEGKERETYLNRLESAHGVLKAAMKTKQTASLEHVKALNEAIDAFAASMK